MTHQIYFLQLTFLTVMNECSVLQQVGCYLGLAVGLVTREVRTVVVMLLNSGRAVALRWGPGVGRDIRIKKLPMPTQKAMARPAANPTNAPWEQEPSVTR